VKKNHNRYYLQKKRFEDSRDTSELIESFAKKIGLEDFSGDLLRTALTHPSYTFENPASRLENNQRLEFLGDAVLDFVIGEYLYLTYP
jgi:ribonuclease-3